MKKYLFLVLSFASLCFVSLPSMGAVVVLAEKVVRPYPCCVPCRPYRIAMPVMPMPYYREYYYREDYYPREKKCIRKKQHRKPKQHKRHVQRRQQYVRVHFYNAPIYYYAPYEEIVLYESRYPY